MATYPERLIPSRGDVLLKRIDNEEIIGRVCRKDDVVPFDEKGNFNFDSIEIRQIPQLSCNLQSLSEPQDLNIELKGESTQLAYKEWKPGTSTPLASQIEFDYNFDWCRYFFLSKDVKMRFKYSEGENEHEIQIDLKHVPTVVNYSHLEFEILDTRRIENPKANDRITKFSESKPRAWQRMIMQQLRRKFRDCVKDNVERLTE